ncbi:D-hydantoinase [bacterium HR40]|nr:D-hydantoinase [bacterium HR40]
MALLIRGGEIVTADSRYRADIWIEDETITRIGPDLPAAPGAEVVDATGKYVFPGFIDPHVHIHLPFMGTFAKDSHETGSIAALVGGTTTYIEMCCPSRADDLLASYELWKSKAEGKSACDYSFHMAVPKFDESTEGELREIVKDGISSFKVFLAYKNFFGVGDEELYRTLQLARELGVITTAHCENAELVARLQQAVLARGITGPEGHEPSRPESVEAEGTHRFVTFLENTGATGYVVHLSCAPALAAAVAGKSRGVPVFVEVVIPHLLLDRSYAERPDFEGAKYVMSPPLRDARNLPVLWNALAHGMIDTVATDHCPFDLAQKDMGRGDFTKIPNGMPAIEERVKLLWTYGVRRGRLDIHRFVDAASTRAAKLFGLFPKKGTVAVGTDADLVIWDPGWRGRISVASQSTNNDYNPFEGFAVEGRPQVVTVRGKVQVRDGVFVGERGRGRLLRREPIWF